MASYFSWPGFMSLLDVGAPADKESTKKKTNVGSWKFWFWIVGSLDDNKNSIFTISDLKME